MSIRRTLIAVLAVAIAIAFAPLSELQAATLTPGSGPGLDNAVVKVAAKKKTTKKKTAKKKGKKKSAKKAKSKGAGSCGQYMYYSKKDRKCADARLKK